MNSVKIGRMVLGMCSTNCYFVYRENSNKVIVIDPADYGEEIYDKLTAKGFEVTAILLTHGHFDHIWGVKALKDKVNGVSDDPSVQKSKNVSVYACSHEKELLANARMNVSADAGRPYTLKADVWVEDGDELSFNEGEELIKCKVIWTPGHTEGGCCYYFEEAGFVVSGDTLFFESVGRTDFPTGSMGKLVSSVKEKLLVLPEETKIYPGHGDETSVQHEKEYNPFL
ncbi:MAG: MBL fold metallo-hydrolase [Lachnospiraceae bacterium]|nr:MBL fold metallo-hydrolase [Lachnospiraceae bacterium]